MHPDGSARLHQARHLMGFIFPDQVAHRIRSYQKPFLPQFAHSESWEPISISGTDSAWQFHGGDGARPYYLAQKGNRLVYIHFYWQVQEDQLEKAMEILFVQTL